MVRSGLITWRLVVALVVLMCTLGAGYAYLQVDKARDHADPDRARRKDLPIPVRTALVSEAEVEEPIGGTVLTQASQVATVEIGASRGFNWVVSDIKLKAIHVWNGVQVHKGQLLFEVAEESFEEITKQAQAQLDASKSNLDYTKANIANQEKIRKLDLASAQSELHYRIKDQDDRRNEYDVIKKLTITKAATDFQLYDIISKWERAIFDRSEAEKKIEVAKDAQTVGLLKDKADLEKAQAEFEKASVDLYLVKHDLERGKIRSPLDGFVNTVTVVPGAEVQVGQVLTQVLKLDPIFAIMDFPQERIDEISVGQSAEVVLDSAPKETLHGKVVRILPQVNPQLRVLPVTIEISNPDNRIKADISGFARIMVKKKARTVPAAAVIQQGSKAIVFCVEKDGRAHIREVRAGKLSKVGELEIKDGLAPGDQVVVYNQYYLEDNDQVDTDWRKWARRD
jgi:RND family efflux transporter MFP subunit